MNHDRRNDTIRIRSRASALFVFPSCLACFVVKHSTMKSLAGQFLVASPHLRDPNFAQSVVLMLQHEEQGALGVDHQSPRRQDGRRSLEDDRQRPRRLRRPGPRRRPGAGAAHRHSRSEATSPRKKSCRKLYMSMQKDAIDLLVRRTGAKFRLFSGHSGWGGGQLENEMRVGGWLTWPAQPTEVFADPERLWKTVCGKIGREIIAPNIPPERIADRSGD